MFINDAIDQGRGTFAAKMRVGIIDDVSHN